MYNESGYIQMCKDILAGQQYRKAEGEEGRYELFAYPLKFDLTGGKLPLLTTKKMPFKPLAVEMLWFISGAEDISLLRDYNVKIWDIWANDQDIVGPLYGFMWRHWKIDPDVQPFHQGTEIDQLGQVMKTLRDKPEARSHMITAWRPDWIKVQSIKPCHIMLQFYRYGDRVSLALYQRSCDTFLGVPFNIAQYSLLLHMVAHQLGCEAGEFTWIGGDVHIYENHVEQVQTQVDQPIYDPPRLRFNRSAEEVGSIDGYRFDDFSVEGYQHGPRLRGDVSPQGTPGQGVAI